MRFLILFLIATFFNAVFAVGKDNGACKKSSLDEAADSMAEGLLFFVAIPIVFLFLTISQLKNN